MCGIVGFAQAGQKWRSTKSLEHRGPDAKYTFNGIHLNVDFYRLAIKGTNGKQPFTSKCENHLVWCNGEIFNYLELANQYNISITDCDISVLPDLIYQLGFDKALKKIRGFFAIVYYNKTTNRVCLGVDHFGIKPLYYQYNKKGLLFGSELKLFAQDKISKIGVKQYLETGATIAPHTLLENVSSLRAAHFVEFNLNNLESPLQEKHYWDPRYEKIVDNSSLTDLIKQAFDRNMMSDFPIANLLSGGIDSTAIALGMNGISENIFFNFGSVKPANQEKRNIEKLKDDLNISEILLEPLTFEEIREFVKASDEIVGDFAGLIYNRLMKEVNHKKYRVVLTGTGGDELFFGYSRYRKIGWLKNLLGLWVNKSPNYRPYDFLKKGFWNKCGIRSDHSLVLSKSDFTTLSEYYRYIDFQNYLPYTLLRYTDRISSYYQIESRTPFLDVDLANYIFQKIKFPQEIGVKTALRRFISSKKSDLNFDFKEGLGLPIERMINLNEIRTQIIPKILTSKIYRELEELSVDTFKVNTRIGKWRIMSLYMLVIWHEEHCSK